MVGLAGKKFAENEKSVWMVIFLGTSRESRGVWGVAGSLRFPSRPR